MPAPVIVKIGEMASKVVQKEQELNKAQMEVGSKLLKELGMDAVSNLQNELSKKEVSQLMNEISTASKDFQNTQIERTEKQGGSYKDVFKEGEGDTKEVHHMPSNDASPLRFQDGPAIKMDKKDHRETASWGNSREAREYRQHQKELIDSGRFRDALNMDIEDIKDKFGDKYDGAISEMMEYVDKLEQEGKI